MCTHLSIEALCLFWWVVLRVASHHTTTDFLDGDVLHVETNIVTGQSFREGLVMHFNRLDLSGNASRRKGNHHTRLKDTSLNTTDRNRTNT